MKSLAAFLSEGFQLRGIVKTNGENIALLEGIDNYLHDAKRGNLVPTNRNFEILQEARDLFEDTKDSQKCLKVLSEFYNAQQPGEMGKSYEKDSGVKIIVTADKDKYKQHVGKGATGNEAGDMKKTLQKLGVTGKIDFKAPNEIHVTFSPDNVKHMMKLNWLDGLGSYGDGASQQRVASTLKDHLLQDFYESKFNENDAVGVTGEEDDIKTGKQHEYPQKKFYTGHAPKPQMEAKDKEEFEKDFEKRKSMAYEAFKEGKITSEVLESHLAQLGEMYSDIDLGNIKKVGKDANQQPPSKKKTGYYGHAPKPKMEAQNPNGDKQPPSNDSQIDTGFAPKSKMENLANFGDKKAKKFPADKDGDGKTNEIANMSPVAFREFKEAMDNNPDEEEEDGYTLQGKTDEAPDVLKGFRVVAKDQNDSDAMKKERKVDMLKDYGKKDKKESDDPSTGREAYKEGYNFGIRAFTEGFECEINEENALSDHARGYYDGYSNTMNEEKKDADDSYDEAFGKDDDKMDYDDDEMDYDDKKMDSKKESICLSEVAEARWDQAEGVDRRKAQRAFFESSKGKTHLKELSKYSQKDGISLKEQADLSKLLSSLNTRLHIQLEHTQDEKLAWGLNEMLTFNGSLYVDVLGYNQESEFLSESVFERTKTFFKSILMENADYTEVELNENKKMSHLKRLISRSK